MIKTLLAAVGGVGAAFASALCCAGPLIAVSFGMSAAGFASTFEPLRPYLLASPGLFLGSGFFLLRREERRACEPGADSSTRRRMKIMPWTAIVAALVFASYPRWSAWTL